MDHLTSREDWIAMKEEEEILLMGNLEGGQARVCFTPQPRKATSRCIRTATARARPPRPRAVSGQHGAGLVYSRET